MYFLKVYVYGLECLHLRRPAEAIGSSGVEDTEGSELSDVGTDFRSSARASKLLTTESSLV